MREAPCETVVSVTLVAVVVLLLIAVIMIVKKLVKLGLIVGAIALGVWLGLQLFDRSG